MLMTTASNLWFIDDDNGGAPVLLQTRVAEQHGITKTIPLVDNLIALTGWQQLLASPRSGDFVQRSQQTENSHTDITRSPCANIRKCGGIQSNPAIGPTHGNLNAKHVSIDGHLSEWSEPITRRWTPTSAQLAYLQHLFYEQGIRNPDTDQISKLTNHLIRYGRIEGRNIFYWFQNQKARERKRKVDAQMDNQTILRSKIPSAAVGRQIRARKALFKEMYSEHRACPPPVKERLNEKIFYVHHDRAVVKSSHLANFEKEKFPLLTARVRRAAASRFNIQTQKPRLLVDRRSENLISADSVCTGNYGYSSFTHSEMRDLHHRECQTVCRPEICTSEWRTCDERQSHNCNWTKAGDSLSSLLFNVERGESQNEQSIDVPQCTEFFPCQFDAQVKAEEAHDLLELKL